MSHVQLPSGQGARNLQVQRSLRRIRCKGRKREVSPASIATWHVGREQVGVETKVRRWHRSLRLSHDSHELGHCPKVITVADGCKGVVAGSRTMAMSPPSRWRPASPGGTLSISACSHHDTKLEMEFTHRRSPSAWVLVVLGVQFRLSLGDDISAEVVVVTT